MMTLSQITRHLLFVAALLGLNSCVETTTSLAQDRIDSSSQSSAEELGQIGPRLLAQHCVSCHGADKQEGELRLDSRQATLAGGSSGPAVIAGDPNASRLIAAVHGAGDVSLMPPKNALPADTIEQLAKWIETGFEWSDADSSLGVSAGGDAWSDPQNPVSVQFNGRRVDLWSLKPMQLPTLPEVIDKTWARTPEDRFVQARLEQASIAPGQEASRRSLLRRVSFDLVGLPPDVQEVDAFERDARPDAFERQVDRLLASPRHGEHVGRQWLDVVRYSDSNGFDWDEFRPLAYRYRDYVVQAMNEDLSYPQFIREQLAGDELSGEAIDDERELQGWIATGFLRMGPRDNAAGLFNEQDRSRAELMQDLVDTTTSAFLAQTYSCCRCHDHKTDPFLHADYYRMRAFFEAVEYADQRIIQTVAESQRDDSIDAEIDAQIQSFKDRNTRVLSAIKQRLLSEGVAEQDLTDERLREGANEEQRESLTKNDARIEELEASKPERRRALVMTETGPAAPATFVLYQGDYRQPRDEVSLGFPSLFDPSSLEVQSSAQTTGRRSQLAEWIVDPSNRWTYRVIANRVWQGLYGQGIVSSSNDFGWTGSAPSHPELLDHLALRIIDDEGSLKLLRRRLVLSASYRQAGAEVMSQGERDRQQHAAEIDPNNRMLWRSPLRRLSAEQTRDAMLTVGDALDSRIGGPSVWPVLPEEVMAVNPALLDDNETRTKGWYPSDESLQRVRSLYLVQKRTVRVPLMETFDLPENSVSCARRDVSIVAPQALSLLNNPMSVRAAQALALRIDAEAGEGATPTQRIEVAYRLALQRSPEAHEVEACEAFLQNRSTEELARVLMNTNEFAFVE